MKTLRDALGVSQLEYMRRVAEEQGFSRRTVTNGNNVQRWETGTTPGIPTQLAIASIHQIPPEAVGQLGWPQFLHLASRNELLTAPWTPAGTIDALNALRWEASSDPRSRPTVTGGILTAFTRKTLNTLVDTPPEPPASRKGPPDVADVIECRLTDLHGMWNTSDPMTHYQFARADLDLITVFLTANNHDPSTRARLLKAVSFIADLCGTIKRILGDQAAAERYNLVSVRAGASSGSPAHTVIGIAELALQHTYAGDPREVLPLIEAARSVSPPFEHRLSAVLHARDSRAHAKLGDAPASTKALDRTATAVSTALAVSTVDGGTTAACAHIDEEWLSNTMGRTWLDLGQPKRALEHFSHLLQDDPTHSSSQPTLFTAASLLAVVEAQLAIGEVDAAAQSAQRATALYPTMPAGLNHQYMWHLHSHRGVPAVRNVLDFLKESLPAT
ncbi:hypothetical protein OG401_41435 [Kitasatospora purpeofusca]|nr:hypothetical protein [Kitasatospora purpeofusca]